MQFLSLLHYVLTNWPRDGRAGGRKNWGSAGRIYRQKYGWTDGWPACTQMDRHTDKQTRRCADTQMNRHTDGQHTNVQTHRWTDTQKYRHRRTDTQMYWHKKYRHTLFWKQFRLDSSGENRAECKIRRKGVNFFGKQKPKRKIRQKRNVEANIEREYSGTCL